jgi:hypothetical protein
MGIRSSRPTVYTLHAFLQLIDLERVIDITGALMVPRLQNWQCVLLMCMVLASKAWDDFSMWNADFWYVGIDYRVEFLV